MSLAAGARVGPYEVIAPLGAGGMGQVYRARDTQLGRDVAIKALPDSMAADQERVARFQREAQVLASLNHPNIGGIHGLQEADGYKYLVLEFIDGVTLGDHIQRVGAGKGLPLADALPIARQILDALEAAHEKGIVHRDLKPANIMMTAEGHVKVLDFGLARVVEPDSGTSTVNSPTFTMAATQAGVILGTAAYMSPEQAKGKVADRRSDVWAFGCVFYEMLTGKRLFEADDVSETLAAVLRADPDWAALPPSLPPGVRAVVQRCLERDRKRRIPDMSVVGFLLAEAMVAPAKPEVPSAGAGRARLLWLGAAFVGGIGLAAIGAWMLGLFAPAPEASAIVRFGITPPLAQRLGPTTTDRQLAVSPDGRYMVYVSGGSVAGGPLMLRRFDQLEAQPLAGAVGRYPFFSHDGKWIGYFGATDLRKVATAGGPSSSLCPVDGPPRGATWTADDLIVFATAGPTGLQSVPAGGGTAKNLTTPALGEGEGDHVFPSALPDGRGVLFTILPTNLQAGSAQIAVADMDGNNRTILIRGASAPDYVAPGYLVYVAANSVRAVRFDAARREVQGDAVTVVQDAGVVLSGVAQVAVSRSGVLTYVPLASVAGTAGAGSDRTLVWVNRQGREEPIKDVPPRAYFALRLSPDGTRLALDSRDRENDIWVWDLQRPNLTRFTFDPGADVFPVWTHDSRRLIFASTRHGAQNLYAQNADGTGSIDRLTETTFGQTAASVLPDGSGLLVTDAKTGLNTDISLVPITGKGPIASVLNSPATERLAQISPDGRFIAYESDESSRMEIYVRPYPDVNGGKFPISVAGGTKPAWSPAGGELFYVDANNMLMVVQVQRSPKFKAGIPVKLFEARNISTLVSGRFYDVTGDGQRFVMIKELPPPPGAAATPAGPTFVVVVNWLQELKAAVGK